MMRARKEQYEKAVCFCFFFLETRVSEIKKKKMPVRHVQQIDMDDVQRRENHAEELGWLEIHIFT